MENQFEYVKSINQLHLLRFHVASTIITDLDRVAPGTSIGLSLDFEKIDDESVLKVKERLRRMQLDSFVFSSGVELFSIFGEPQMFVSFHREPGDNDNLIKIKSSTGDFVNVNDDRISIEVLLELLGRLEFIYGDHQDGIDLSKFAF